MKGDKALQKAKEVVENINKEWFATNSIKIKQTEIRLKQIAKQFKIPFKEIANEVLWLADALR